MSSPGEEIGLEKHEGHDQFIRVESGTGDAVLDTLYSPPEHPHGTVHRTKRDEPDGH